MNVGGSDMDEQQDTSYNDILVILEEKVEESSSLAARRQFEHEAISALAVEITKFILDGRKAAANEKDPLKALKHFDSLSLQLLSHLQQKPAHLLQEKAFYSGQITSSQELIEAIKKKQDNNQKKLKDEEELKKRIQAGEFKRPRKIAKRPEKLKNIRDVETKMAQEKTAQESKDQ